MTGVTARWCRRAEIRLHFALFQSYPDISMMTASAVISSARVLHIFFLAMADRADRVGFLCGKSARSARLVLRLETSLPRERLKVIDTVYHVTSCNYISYYIELH